jgi:hypothetical protein
MSPKIIFRVGGVILSILGVMCVPIGIGVNPKRDQSVFYNLADLGAFTWPAAALISIGVIAMVASRWLPGDPMD